ncbi:MAG: SMC family ATPase [Candidatus Omnitrophica bacterium]|nr:SMC family ATPase [Candidatus Omnitrophota bacterium]
MFLRSLKLRNYRKFRDEPIEFPEGIIGIIGPNGAGKSSILEAIGWALYGNQLTRSDKSEVKSQNAALEEDCEVELIFDLGGHSYKVLRQLKGRNSISNALAFIDGNIEPVAERDSGVNQYIELLLGMDYVTFLRTIYAKQKDLAALSSLAPEARKKVIRRMLNIDRIDSAVTQIRVDTRDKQRFVEGIQSSLENIEELEVDKKELEGQQSSINKNIGVFTTELNIIKDERQKLRKEKEDQEAKYKTYNQFSSDVSRLSTQITSLKRKLSDSEKDLEELKKNKETLDKLEPKEKEYLKVKEDKSAQETLRLKFQEKLAFEKNWKEMKEEIDGREKELKAAIEQLKLFSSIQKDSDSTEKALRDKEVSRRKLEKEVKDAEGKVSVYSSQLEELIHKKKSISQLGGSGKCPTCFRELGEDGKDILLHLDNEISKVKEKLIPSHENRDKVSEQLEDVMAEQEKLVEQKNKLNEKLKKKSKIEQSIEEQDNEVKKLSFKITRTEEKISGMKDIKFDRGFYAELLRKFDTLSETRDSILELRKEIQRIPKIVEAIDSTRKEINDLENTLENKEEDLKKLEFNEKRFEKIKANYEELSDKLLTGQNKLDEAKGKTEVLKQRISNIKERMARRKENQKRIEAASLELQYLQRLELLLDKFRLELTGRIRPLLEARTSFLFSEITDGRYPSVELDEDYELSILDGDKYFKLKRFSGGEEDLANLCLRIAMSQVIAERSGGVEINFIALDEIFGSQDEDRRQNIMNSFNKLSSQFRQIFLISHIEEIREMLNRVLRVEENGTRKESKVSLV